MLPTVRVLPRAPGVYLFRDARGQLLYVGRAGQLRSRVASYWSTLADRPHLRAMVRRIGDVEAMVCASEHEAAVLEQDLLRRRLPRYNRTDGVETTLWLRLDPARGIVLLREPTPDAFGPYLGSTATRLAVRGLERLFPAFGRRTVSELALAGARSLSLDGDPRPVLDRDPLAVAAALQALTGLRDDAVRAQGFEAARARQDELDALTWLSAPQRFGGGDSGTYTGSADGVSVTVEVRAGWIAARTVDGPAGETTGPWAAFAQQQAGLYAALVAAGARPRTWKPWPELSR